MFNFFRFVKTWRIQNPGDDEWPPGCQLIFTGGNQLSAPDRVLVGPLLAKMSTDISIEMCSPAEQGTYMSKWRMTTSQGNFFGGNFLFFVF